MTQLHFTISSEDIQSLIKESVDNKIARDILTKLFNQLMEKERDEYLENEAYQRDPDRKTYRNGYYDRAYTTKIASITLRVPRTRDGKFSTELFERYQRNEKALISTMLEMYVQGVSTRKVTKVMEELCGQTYSKSFVSSLTKQLDEDVNKWPNRDISIIKYPYLLVDVVYIKVRENKRVVSKACHIAIGISEKGKREILGLDICRLSSVAKLDDRLYGALKDLGINVISQRSAGFDMYNLDKMNELDMKLINVPSYSPNAIGEFVVASALYFSRNLNLIHENVKKHDFRWQLPILSREIRTMTVGIVGTGRIGRACAKLFKGLGANIIGYDVYESEEAKELLDYVSLDDLYAQSDIITFHVPATDDNYHMINEDSISKMKDGIILVNAARGTILDTKAVLKALDDGKIKGAALDVYEHEFDIVNK